MSDLIQKKTKGSFVTGLFLLLLFLATLNTLGRYYYFVYIAFIVLMLNSNRKFRIDISVVSLLVLAFSWMVFSPESTISVFGVVKPYTYLLCYFMGYSYFDGFISEESKEKVYLRFYKLVAIVSAGPLFHYILNWIKNGDAVERNTVDIWTGVVMGATGQASLACLPLALAIACLFIKTNAKIKLVALVTVIVVLGYNLILSGRTIILLSVILCALAFLYRMGEVKKGRFTIILLVLAVILLIIFIYNNNVFGIKSFVESSPLYDRFYGENSMDIGEDGRLRKKIMHLKNFLEYPFGGAHSRKLAGHAHDLYLDTYDEAGIFAFVAVIIYAISSIFRLVKSMKDKRFPFAFRQIVFCIYIVLNIEFWIEPTLQGMPWMFSTYCLIDGALMRFISDKEDDTAMRIKA